MKVFGTESEQSEEKVHKLLCSWLAANLSWVHLMGLPLKLFPQPLEKRPGNLHCIQSDVYSVRFCGFSTYSTATTTTTSSSTTRYFYPILIISTCTRFWTGIQLQIEMETIENINAASFHTTKFCSTTQLIYLLCISLPPPPPPLTNPTDKNDAVL